MNTMHACEDNDASCSEGHGMVFYRDPNGHGHWLCSHHRDIRRVNDRTPGTGRVRLPEHRSVS